MSTIFWDDTRWQWCCSLKPILTDWVYPGDSRSGGRNSDWFLKWCQSRFWSQLMIVVQVQESSKAAWFQIDLGEEHLVSGIQVVGFWGADDVAQIRTLDNFWYLVSGIQVTVKVIIYDLNIFEKIQSRLTFFTLFFQSQGPPLSMHEASYMRYIRFTLSCTNDDFN